MIKYNDVVSYLYTTYIHILITSRLETQIIYMCIHIVVHSFELKRRVACTCSESLKSKESSFRFLFLHLKCNAFLIERSKRPARIPVSHYSHTWLCTASWTRPDSQGEIRTPLHTSLMTSGRFLSSFNLVFCPEFEFNIAFSISKIISI